MRRHDEEVDAIEFLPVHFGLGRQLEERIERDDRLGTGRAFADDSRPHGIVKFGVVVFGCGHEADLPSIVVVSAQR